jgi:hypothetical protein
MASDDSSAAAPRGNPADLKVTVDHVDCHVVLTLLGECVELRLAPAAALELCLRLAAAAARLLRIER